MFRVVIVHRDHTINFWRSQNLKNPPFRIYIERIMPLGKVVVE